MTEKQGEKVTLEDDIGHLRRVHSHLYGRYLDDIDRDLLDSLAQSRLSDGVTNATVNRMLEVVRAILNRAERDWEWIERAPRVRMVPEAKRRVRWLTREEAEVLLSELPEHLAAMAQFTLATGLRESNVVKLEWSQVDLDRRCAWIHADQAKARKAIPVPLNGEAVIVVRRQTGKQPVRRTNIPSVNFGQINALTPSPRASSPRSMNAHHTLPIFPLTRLFSPAAAACNRSPSDGISISSVLFAQACLNYVSPWLPSSQTLCQDHQPTDY